jgi:hypothetical protein
MRQFNPSVVSYQNSSVILNEDFKRNEKHSVN